ncbi:MAG: PorT family protein [Bacteroidetes bacterium]|nr:PorT family protein [Bacteroidota bacterium]MBL0020744.1 PorT family protein [Bacteroidota bacterium]
MHVESIRKVILPLGLVWCLAICNLQAQTSHYFDQRPFNLGFTMGMCLARYDMTAQINQFDQSTGIVVHSVQLVPKPGVYLGLITNLNLADHWDLRFMPSVSLEERDFLFYLDSTTTNAEPVVRKKIESSNLNMPLAIKFKSDFHKNLRVWVMFGLQPSLNLASSKKVLNDPDLLKVKSFDLQYLASVGVDIYGEKLKLSPELRFTRGLQNIYVPERTRFPRAISDLFSQLLVLNINFE